MIAANLYLLPSHRNTSPMIPSRRVIRVLDQRPLLTAEDLRIHAWISDRLAIVRREQHGLWSKVRRLFSVLSAD